MLLWRGKLRQLWRGKLRQPVTPEKGQESASSEFPIISAYFKHFQTLCSTQKCAAWGLFLFSFWPCKNHGFSAFSFQDMSRPSLDFMWIWVFSIKTTYSPIIILSVERRKERAKEESFSHNFHHISQYKSLYFLSNPRISPYFTENRENRMGKKRITKESRPIS